MRFTEGVWYGRENIEISSAQEVGKLELPSLARPYYPSLSDAAPSLRSEHYSKSTSPASIRALCHTRPIQHRGDSINKPTITLTISSPAEGIIAVEAKHFVGKPAHKEPRVKLLPGGRDQGFSPDINLGDSATGSVLPPFASLVTGSAEARLSLGKGDFSIDFYNVDCKSGTSQPLTRVKRDHLSWILDKDASPKAAAREHAVTTISDPYHRDPNSRRQSYMKVGLDLGVGEKVYGFGERFGPFVKNGQSIEVSNEDGGTSSAVAYKNVPFYLTNRGYGVYFDHTDHVSVEVQSDVMTKVQASVPGETIRFHVIVGATPKEILSRYTLLTGRPPLPPAWSYGLWLSTSFLTSYNEDTVAKFIEGMEQRDIPLHVFHFDCFWMPAHEWCSFKFDPEYFPDPAGFLGRLKERGLQVCVWINSYIGQESRLFAEGDEKGYFVKRVDGRSWQTDDWQAGMALVDSTNPGATKWYKDQLRALVKIGVSSFKTDFGERIPAVGVVYHDGSDPRAMHNYYTHMYNQAVYDVLVEELGKDEACVFARSGIAGGQTMPVHWGGDCDQEWTGMAETLRGGMSLGLSGYGYFSHDIGGFKAEGKNSAVRRDNGSQAAIYKRWVQFGLLCSHSRLHGSDTYRVPWNFDDEASIVLSKFTKLKNRLEPYFTTLSIEARDAGHPLLRATLLEFPEEPVAWTLDTQYMLGSSLLVAPVFDVERVEYWVPPGRWTNLLSGKVVTGPRYVSESHGMLTLPLLLKPNSGIIIGKSGHSVLDSIGADHGFTLVLSQYAKADFGVTTKLRSGASITCAIAVSRADGDKPGNFEVKLVSGDLQGASWDVLLIGEGVGLDASEPGKRLTAGGADGKCVLEL